MQLVKLLKHIGYYELIGSTDKVINGIAFDSRKVNHGYLFVVQRGLHVDGHQFIESAVLNGATTIVCEEFPENVHEAVTYIRVSNTKTVLGELAAAFHGFPSKKMKVIGITGTNGKTSIVTLLHSLFLKQGFSAGLISTISYKINEKEETATHTTPDALKIQQLMAEMVNAGCGVCFMEVSSHAVDQRRIAGINFSGGIFTNITHDHLDYHKTFTDYLKAKKQFFDELPKHAFALTNIDDKNGLIMVQNTRAEKRTYSIRAMADYRCKVLENHFTGMLLKIDEQEIWTRFIGKFNASNMLAVYAAAIELGQQKEEVLTVLSGLKPVKGRFEIIESVDGRFAVVDYAHTPDALKNVLKAITELRGRKEQLITVVGAGGDRDKTKRPQMAMEAVLASDRVILTSDNPRTEDPSAIIRDMEAGIEPRFKHKAVSIENRREAIKTATFLAKPGDIILVAGKGHENYQEINGVKHHFDDVEEIKDFFGIEK